MNTRRDKRRFWAAVLCVVAVLAMTVGGPGVLKMRSVYAEAPTNLGVFATGTTIATGEELEITANVKPAGTWSDSSQQKNIEWRQSSTDGGSVSGLPDSTNGDNPTITVKGEKAGTVTITAQVRGTQITGSIKITVTTGAPEITTSKLADGTVGATYSATLKADGSTPIEWSVKSGKLPDGLQLNKTTGRISGKPTDAGTYKFTVEAKNTAGTDEKELSITITDDASASFEIKDQTLEKGVIGNRYTAFFEIVSTGGRTAASTALKWEQTGLPAELGLTMESYGTLQGVPTTAGTFPFTVTAKTADGKSSASKDFTLIVEGTEKAATISGGGGKTGNDIAAIQANSSYFYDFVNAQKPGTGEHIWFVLNQEVLSSKESADGKSQINSAIGKYYFGVAEKELSINWFKIDITKYTKKATDAGYDMKKGKAVTDTGDTILEFKLYVDKDIIANGNLAVFRYHDGKAERFTERSNHHKDPKEFKDKTFYVDKDTSTVYVYSNGFSTFALVAPTVPTVAVVLNANGGTVDEDEVIVAKDEKMKEPGATREGYKFDGWYTEDGKKWDFSKKVEENMTLIAHWNQSDSGTTKSSSTLASSSTISGNNAGGDAAAGGRNVSAPQTNDRLFALWGVILLIVVLNGAYIALAARKARGK